VLYLRLIIFLVGDDVFVDSETLLVTDFVNLKIKPTQSFKDAHRDGVCVYIHRGECSYVYEYLHLYCVSKKRLMHTVLASDEMNLNASKTMIL
jgi:hypothetical protein